MSKAAALQMASGPNVKANLDTAAGLIAQAVDAGAELIVLPENFACMAMSDKERNSHAEQPGSGYIQDFLANQSRKHKIWLVGGTVPIVSNSPNKTRSACMLYDASGEMVARYDKIHMFDVHNIQGSGESYHESETTEAGESIVVVDTPFGRLGIAVCYDLRFPELFRVMNDQGMEICALPSAFTAITGKSHWEPLLRARAIENQCYMIAADQGGFHINGRETYGNSMIIDPWGNILNRLMSGAGVIVSELDQDFLRNTRKNFPVLEHRQLNCRIQ